ncbi:MAG: bifunctional diguanylate cyclase/phosphodiesterase [Acidovorax sp.]|nr:bifunctional diguanylate cyclase/phosphodiesterase [Acidovorax sp.]MDP3229304.1 bifunctional diguanylate cyclase/phosphodiesterase [Acidovorax sp.]
MLASFLFNLAVLRSGIRTMYWDESAAAGRLRHEHLQAVVKLTPLAMSANVGTASTILWAFWGNWTPGLIGWWTAMFCLASLAARNWWQFRNRRSRTVSCRGIQRSTWHAAALAGLWAVMPMAWFADANSSQQLLIGTLFTGMMGAGAFVLGPLPLASVAYVTLFAISPLVTLALVQEPMMAGASVLVGFYATMVLGGALSYWRKATALMQSQTEAVRHEQMLSVMLHDFEQNTTDALWETDAQGRLRNPSPRLARLLYTGSEALQSLPLPQWLTENCADGAAALATAIEKGAPFRSIALVTERQGRRHHLAIHGKPLFDEMGEPAGWRGVVADRTAVVRVQEELHLLAHTDSLTQLSNRFAMHTAVNELFGKGVKGAALLLLDLDHFKSINDSFGHSVGDALLASVGERLREHAPPHSLIARLGGDEFAVLIRPAERAASDARSPQLLADTLVAALGRTYQLGERRLRVGASIGLAHVDQDVTSVDELLVRADIALYDAKAQGRGRAAAYSPALRERTQRRSMIEDGLRQAVRHDELALHWQPKVDLSTWKITGAEALMRWTHPTLGPISPGEFIPIAEQAGLIELMGLWALRHACECGQNQLQLQGTQVAVNVSAVQLADPQFVQLVQSVLESTRLPPERLELEITESVFIEDTEAALRQLHALRGLGVHIALDDFGTGYSSLSYLCRFPFSSLKIDRSFVVEAMVRPEALAIVHGIAGLARSLGMRTVCEGIETREQLAMIIDAGIDEAQGYLLSKPRPLDHFQTFTERWDTDHAPLEFLPSGTHAAPAPRSPQP